MTTDIGGRQYLKLADCVEGKTIELDDGFTCRPEGFAVVHVNSKGRAFFYCDNGTHFLDGQCDDDIYCIGVYPK